MATIFLSYRRRGESAGYAHRLADRLKEHFGDEQFFRDIDDIEGGADFVHVLARAVGACKVFISVIGPDWLTLADAAGRRRIDNPRDPVRLELAGALQRSTAVIPVLVGGAKLPETVELPEDLRPLTRRQALELSDTRWDYDVGKLLQTLENKGLRPQGRPKPERPPRSKVRRWAIGVGLSIVVGPLLLGTLIQDPTPWPPRVDPVAAYQPSLIAAIRQGDEAEVEAFRDLDPTPLYAIFTGDALTGGLRAIQAFQNLGVYAVSRLEDQRFEGFSLSPDGSQAQVQVVETWSQTAHSQMDGSCVGRTPAHEVPQTVFLARTATGWSIYAIQFHSVQPAMVPC